MSVRFPAKVAIATRVWENSTAQTVHLTALGHGCRLLNSLAASYSLAELLRYTVQTYTLDERFNVRKAYPRRLASPPYAGSVGYDTHLYSPNSRTPNGWAD